MNAEAEEIAADVLAYGFAASTPQAREQCSSAVSSTKMGAGSIKTEATHQHNRHESPADACGSSDLPGSNSKRKRKCVGSDAHDVVEFAVEPTAVIEFPASRDHVNHSYRDFSLVPPGSDYVACDSIKDMSFAQKVHHILSQAEFNNWIGWMPHGRGFRVHVPVIFERKVCHVYFGHKRYSSFLRELSNHGFKHITKGKDRNTYYHELMLRGMPHLTQAMPRKKAAKRLIAVPENEPDFYKISAFFPLQDERSSKPTKKQEDATTRVETETEQPPSKVARSGLEPAAAVVPFPSVSTSRPLPPTLNSLNFERPLPSAHPPSFLYGVNPDVNMLSRLLSQNSNPALLSTSLPRRSAVRTLEQQLLNACAQPNNPQNIDMVEVLRRLQRR